MDRSELAELSFFEGFDDATLDRIAEIGEEVEAQAGALIIDQGAVGTEAFVVRSGTVSILVSGEKVADVGPGSILGEMALLDLRPRSASAVASTDTVLVAFDKARFTDIIDQMPADARAQLAANNERFRTQNAAVSKAKSPSEVARKS